MALPDKLELVDVSVIKLDLHQSLIKTCAYGAHDLLITAQGSKMELGRLADSVKGNDQYKAIASVVASARSRPHLTLGSLWGTYEK